MVYTSTYHRKISSYKIIKKNNLLSLEITIIIITTFLGKASPKAERAGGLHPANDFRIFPLASGEDTIISL